MHLCVSVANSDIGDSMVSEEQPWLGLCVWFMYVNWLQKLTL